MAVGAHPHPHRAGAQWTQWDLFALFWSRDAAVDPVVDAEWQAVGAATRKGAVAAEFAQIVLLKPETADSVALSDAGTRVLVWRAEG